MRFRRMPRLASLAFTVLLVAPTAACGDDDTDDTGAETGPSPTSTSESTSSTDAGTSTTGADSSSTSTGSVDSTSTTAASSSSDDGSTTGPVEDPAYPRPEDGECPEGNLPVSLPGVEICSPFCGGPDDACPVPATGDAMPVCTPFAGAGGSGTPCEDGSECPDGETCNDGACAEIAFYACQLFCGMGEACPDGMECSGIATCGYP